MTRGEENEEVLAAERAVGVDTNDDDDWGYDNGGGGGGQDSVLSGEREKTSGEETHYTTVHAIMMLQYFDQHVAINLAIVNGDGA